MHIPQVKVLQIDLKKKQLENEISLLEKQLKKKTTNQIASTPQPTYQPLQNSHLIITPSKSLTRSVLPPQISQAWQTGFKLQPQLDNPCQKAVQLLDLEGLKKRIRGGIKTDSIVRNENTVCQYIMANKKAVK